MISGHVLIKAISFFGLEVAETAFEGPIFGVAQIMALDVVPVFRFVVAQITRVDFGGGTHDAGSSVVFTTTTTTVPTTIVIVFSDAIVETVIDERDLFL